MSIRWRMPTVWLCSANLPRSYLSTLTSKRVVVFGFSNLTTTYVSLFLWMFYFPALDKLIFFCVCHLVMSFTLMSKFSTAQTSHLFQICFPISVFNHFLRQEHVLASAYTLSVRLCFQHQKDFGLALKIGLHFLAPFFYAVHQNYQANCYSLSLNPIVNHYTLILILVKNLYLFARES